MLTLTRSINPSPASHGIPLAEALWQHMVLQFLRPLHSKPGNRASPRPSSRLGVLVRSGLQSGLKLALRLVLKLVLQRVLQVALRGK